MRINPMEVMTLPLKVVEFELHMADRMRRAASRAIYQTFSSEYIAHKRIAEDEQRKREDVLLGQRLDMIAATIPPEPADTGELVDDLVLDIRDSVDPYPGDFDWTKIGAEPASTTNHR